MKKESLYFDGARYIFISIQEFLEENGITNEVLINNVLPELKDILDEMEKKGFIEERHFLEQNNGRVDYSLESEGGRWLNKRREQGINIDEKWKIPDGIVRYKDKEMKTGDIKHPFKA